jgi:type II secretory pathway component PulC
MISKADQRLDGMLKSELFKNKLFEPSTLKNVNRYLVVILAVLLLYFLVDLIFARPYKNVQALVSKASAPSQNEKKSAAGQKDMTVVKDYSSYSGSIPGKTVFGQSQGGPVTPEDVGSGDISAQVGLVGIIAGDNPQAIIEDKKAQKTYYLNKGQSFNGYVVEEILENKVILDFEGKKISLFL